MTTEVASAEEPAWKACLPEFCSKEPSLTAEMIADIRRTWAKVESGMAPGFPTEAQGGEDGVEDKVSDPLSVFGTEFYRELFASTPGAQDLFPKNMTKQRRHLAAAISNLTTKLDSDLSDPSTPVVKYVVRLSERHGKYGTLPAHYAPVGLALVTTLAKFLGPDMTEPVKAAWIELYSWLVSVMMPITYRQSLSA